MAFKRKYFWYNCCSCGMPFSTEQNFYDDYGFLEKGKKPMCLACRAKPYSGRYGWVYPSDSDDEC